MPRTISTSRSRPAGPIPIPAAGSFMLCRLVADSFDDPNWLFQPKLDGLRIMCRYDGKKLSLVSRNGIVQNLQFPDILAALKPALRHPILLDGEIVCLDKDGRTTFRQIQQRFHVMDQNEIARRAAEFPALFYVFDILHHRGRDVTPLPLDERLKLLKPAVKWSARIRLVPSMPTTGKKLLTMACSHGEEGIVGKRLDSPYTPGSRQSWIKIKCSGRQEFVIGGFTDPKGARHGLGALLVGYYNKTHLTYAGKVGAGFTDRLLVDTRHRLDAISQKDCPFTANTPPRGRQVHWVKPELVAEIAFAEWTQNNLLRHPRFQGLRPDKRPSQIHRETPT